MKFSESFSLALSNIRSGKMRSFLTMLGIIIGIAAVMVIVGLGNGMEHYMIESFQDMGTDTLTIQFTGIGSAQTVSTETMYQLVEEYPEYYRDITPSVMMRGTIKIGRETNKSATTTGVSETYLNIKKYSLREGRGIQYIDIEKRSRICVIGSYVADEWFSGSAIGKTLRISGSEYTIVGVLDSIEKKPQEGGNDDVILLPYSTAARAQGSNRISMYMVQITDEEIANECKVTMEQELFKRFRDEDAYSVISMTEILDMMKDIIGVNVAILGIIAGISLVVGGVGIMNIMLVSVSERTREIGIRKALGAKERYILSQFVIEAGLTSAIGGMIGIAVGYIFSALVSVLITTAMEVDISVTPTMFSILLAFGASAAIGILFGYLPARKAAQLNPIDALRHD